MIAALVQVSAVANFIAGRLYGSDQHLSGSGNHNCVFRISQKMLLSDSPNIGCTNARFQNGGLVSRLINLG